MKKWGSIEKPEIKIVVAKKMGITQDLENWKIYNVRQTKVFWERWT
jgi:hypothetical protein